MNTLECHHIFFSHQIIFRLICNLRLWFCVRRPPPPDCPTAGAPRSPAGAYIGVLILYASDRPRPVASLDLVEVGPDACFGLNYIFPQLTSALAFPQSDTSSIETKMRSWAFLSTL